MPRHEPAIPASAARVRALQARLPELSVPALLRVRDAVEPLLESDRVSVRDVSTVLRAAQAD